MKTINITYANQDRLNNPDRKKVQRMNPFKKIILNLTIGITSLSMLAGCSSKIEAPHQMPEEYIQMYVSEDVESGDTLTAIAKEYYDSEVYDSYYGSLENYIDEIANINQINKNNINPYQRLSIPVFVDEQNTFYQQINILENKIKELPRWVNYIVQPGDTILALAYRGAGSTNEAYSIKDEIMSKNGLKNSSIRDGMELKIVNPEIGAIKTEIARLRELLDDSVKVDDPSQKVN